MNAIDPQIARAIRLVSLDVDGVLTDGSFTAEVGRDGGVVESCRFSVLDGLGIHLLQSAGLRVAFVSGRRSEAVRARARDLGVEEVHLGVPFGKVEAIEQMLKRNGWEWSQVAHLGDDLADVAAMERVGLPAAVGNAVAEVRAAAEWVGAVRGGEGAVREFARALLDARGEWEDQVRVYVARGQAP
ncbi:MAG: KdsC family phosphatase [Gemmatimonadota bacterium]